MLCDDGCLPTQVGFESFGTDLPEDVSQEDLLKVVADYNADPKVSQHAVLFGWCMPCYSVGGRGRGGAAPGDGCGFRVTEIVFYL